MAYCLLSYKAMLKVIAGAKELSHIKVGWGGESQSILNLLTYLPNQLARSKGTFAVCQKCFALRAELKQKLTPSERDRLNKEMATHVEFQSKRVVRSRNRPHTDHTPRLTHHSLHLPSLPLPRPASPPRLPRPLLTSPPPRLAGPTHHSTRPRPAPPPSHALPTHQGESGARCCSMRSRRLRA